jgi:hypothetical protein
MSESESESHVSREESVAPARASILVHDQLDIPAVHSRHRWRDTPVGDRPRCAEIGLSIGVVRNERIGDLEDVAWEHQPADDEKFPDEERSDADFIVGSRVCHGFMQYS